MDSWLDIAVSGIRFGPDRRAVRAELAGHMEDKIADLRRIFPDIPEEEARDRALSSMGDPEELKRALAKIHRPWLGWLWQFSRGLMWGTLVVFLFICVSKNDYYQSAGFPLWMDWTAHFAAPADRSPERAEVGGYTFRIVEGVYLEDRDEYLLTLRASSPRFWERLDEGALNDGLTAVKPDGTRWPMGQELETGAVTAVRLARWGPFSREFSVYVPAEEWSGEDWVTLELEAPQGGFVLSALVTESVVEP